MVKKIKLIAGGVMAIILLLSAFGHFFSPEIYLGFIPDFLPKSIVNIGAGLIELILGIGVFIPKYRRTALMGIYVLMILFLPLHILDIFRENPVIGSKNMALIRVPVQLLFIYLPKFAQSK